MTKKFTHQALLLTESKPLIFTAMSKHIFYYRLFISKFVLEQDCVPVNPFTSFDYFMLDTVPRDIVRAANNNLLMRSDQLWVFGPISDGVLVEIKIARSQGKIIRFFKIENASTIIECKIGDLMIEDDVVAFKQEIAQL
ncbi:hypothetical protein K2X40_01830 [Candidatus Babeliales bacterium]|nr:hypothetical protein [Candidatus Babeliales bacterium]